MDQNQQFFRDASGADAAGLVSVIIIFFNGEPYIDEAIASVFAQTYDDWELLLCDDGSTDGSSEKARALAARHPQRVRYLEHPGHANLRQAATRDLGLRHARGEYLAYLDADDIWLPEKLERQVQLLRQHPDVAMVYGPMVLWHSHASGADLTTEDVVKQLADRADTVVQPPAAVLRQLTNRQGGFPATCSATIRTVCLRAVGGSEAAMSGMYEEEAVFAKLLLTYPAYVMAEPLDRYRKHGASFCDRAVVSGAYSIDPDNDNPSREAFLRWLIDYCRKQDHQDVLKSSTRVWSNVLRRRAAKHQEQGDCSRAEALVREAMILSPETPVLSLVLASVLLDCGKTEAAIPVLESLIIAECDDDTLAGAARLLRKAGNVTSAMAAIRRAASLAPAGRHGIQLAQLLLTDGQLEEAETAVRAGLQHNPAARGGQSLLARILRRRGKLEAALDAIRAALAVNQDHAEDRHLAGSILNGLQRWREAMVHHDRAVALAPEVARYQTARNTCAARLA